MLFSVSSAPPRPGYIVVQVKPWFEQQRQPESTRVAGQSVALSASAQTSSTFTVCGANDSTASVSSWSLCLRGVRV